MLRTAPGARGVSLVIAAGTGRRWAIVLAAGDGSRLAAITRDARGRIVPKQFCRFEGRRSMLAHTLARARRAVGGDRVVCVVAERHRRWWIQELRELPVDHIVIQPENRGTAAGILLPLLTVHERDPSARIAVLPSDHAIERERVLASALEAAFETVDLRPLDLVLLGITPDAPESGYGWILPAPSPTPPDGSRAVRRFVEKPGPIRARAMRAQGGLWSSFLFTARSKTLLELYDAHAPRLLAELVAWRRSTPRESAAYASLPALDFSRDVLEPSVERLRVLAVPSCGWSDLGTPERLESWRRTRVATAAQDELVSIRV